MDLGVAFQLTNFIRDLAEDLDRGRIYLPLEDLDRFGVTEDDFRARHVGPAFRRLLVFEARRARALYRRAEMPAGSCCTPPRRPACASPTGSTPRILDEVERADWQVFRARAAVPAWRKGAIAGRELVWPSRPTATPDRAT